MPQAHPVLIYQSVPSFIPTYPGLPIGEAGQLRERRGSGPRLSTNRSDFILTDDWLPGHGQATWLLGLPCPHLCPERIPSASPSRHLEVHWIESHLRTQAGGFYGRIRGMAWTCGAFLGDSQPPRRPQAASELSTYQCEATVLRTWGSVP